jgi:hypothetical protein
MTHNNPKLNNSILKWLNIEYGDLRKVKNPENLTTSYFLKGNKVIFDFNSKYNVSFISPEISSRLDDFFGLDENHRKTLLRYWIKLITGFNIIYIIEDDFVANIRWMDIK